MKNSLLVLVAVVLAAVASAVTTALIRGAPGPRAADGGPPAAAMPEGSDAAELATALVQLSLRQDELARALDELRVAVRSSRTEAPRSAPAAERPVEAPLLAAVTPAKSARAAEAGALTVESALARLLEPGIDEEAHQALWREAREAGLLDELVAAFEERAAAAPGDPEKQLELGNAYLQKTFEVGSGPEAGIWATKADQAFDAALAIDDNHWEARFSKAVSLSFWPPVVGKQGQAIQHFELLVQQQAGSNEPQYAQTHLLLGNLYQQTGRPEQALAAWQAGLKIFPEDPQLKAQVGSYQKN
jgi:tetratricopeptide (TPR) repeat protein